MGSKSAKSPDYVGAAEKQGQSALANTNAQTLANRPNQYTPFGSSEWTKNEGSGQWTQNVTLSPEEQRALTAQQNMQAGRSELAGSMIGRTEQELQDPFAWGNMPSYGAAPTPTIPGGGPSNQPAYGQIPQPLQGAGDPFNPQASNPMSPAPGSPPPGAPTSGPNAGLSDAQRLEKNIAKLPRTPENQKKIANMERRLGDMKAGRPAQTAQEAAAAQQAGPGGKGAQNNPSYQGGGQGQSAPGGKGARNNPSYQGGGPMGVQARPGSQGRPPAGATLGGAQQAGAPQQANAPQQGGGQGRAPAGNTLAGAQQAGGPQGSLEQRQSQKLSSLMGEPNKNYNQIRRMKEKLRQTNPDSPLLAQLQQQDDAKQNVNRADNVPQDFQRSGPMSAEEAMYRQTASAQDTYNIDKAGWDAFQNRNSGEGTEQQMGNTPVKQGAAAALRNPAGDTLGGAQQAPGQSTGQPPQMGRPPAGNTLGGAQQAQSGTQGTNGIPQNTQMTGDGNWDVQRNLDFSNLQELDAAGQYNPDFAKTQYDRQMSLRQPQMEGQVAALETKLRNQGLRPGTEAFDNAMGSLMTQQGEEMSRMSQDAMALGAQEQDRQFQREFSARGQGAGEIGQQGSFYNQSGGQGFGQDLSRDQFTEQQRSTQFGEGMQEQQFGEQQRGNRFGEQAQQFGQEMTAAQMEDARRNQQAGQQLAYGQQNFNQQMQQSTYQNQLRQQAIAEEAMRRGMSINEMNALISGQQVSMPTMPGFSNATKAEAIQYGQAAQNQGQLNMSNAANATALATGAMGAMGSMSDIRLKKNIRKIGSTEKGTGLYSWDWNEIGKRITGAISGVGVIAQELMKIQPEAVSMNANGYLQVDYSKVI